MNRIKFVSFLLLTWSAVSPLHGQSVPAVVPPQDYAIYAAVTGRFTEGDRKKIALSKPRLFINEYTEVPRPYGFDVDFKDVGSRSLSPFPRKESPLNTPEWAAFIATVDTSQFKRYRLERLPKSAGYKAQFVSAARRGRTSSRSGFFRLQHYHKRFAGVVSYSQVVYSTDGQKAVCYYSRVSGVEAGAGWLVFVEEKAVAGKWWTRSYSG